MPAAETTIAREIPETGVNLFLYISEVLNHRVLDADGGVVGKLADLKVEAGGGSSQGLQPGRQETQTERPL